ncbi:MAG: hypothetical protein ACOVT5_00085 [Armatimonadaceae bacterium]
MKGADGKKVAEPDGGRDMGGISTLVKLPTDGSHTFTLLMAYWATFDSPGESTVPARRNLSLVLLALPVEEREKAKPVVVTLTASATIAVTKPDAKMFGDLIATLGEDLLKPQRSVRATKMLLGIPDERVTPTSSSWASARGWNCGTKPVPG